eukprot:1344711-Lingulodinium_polyedra.AAC.1
MGPGAAAGAVAGAVKTERDLDVRASAALSDERVGRRVGICSGAFTSVGPVGACKGTLGVAESGIQTVAGSCTITSACGWNSCRLGRGGAADG